MKIGLVSSVCKNKDIIHNIKKIEYFASKCSKESFDLICFGESFVQGFDSLCWKYNEDKNIALSSDSKEIYRLKKIAKEHSIAISTGFIELKDDCIYSSNIVIDKKGNISDIYRRVSSGWKENRSSFQYKEGKGFHVFSLEGHIFCTAICGDLWFEDNINNISNMDFDVLLWPLYIDYEVYDWNNDGITDYSEQTKRIKRDVLMINSIIHGEANGGCVVFYNGDVKKKLAMCSEGVLSFFIN